MPTIAVTNQKGGVGKTTTTYHFARAASLRGLRVLVVDLDPQGNLSDSLAELEEQQAGVADALSTRSECDLGDVIVRRIGIGGILPPRVRMPWRPCVMSS